MWSLYGLCSDVLGYEESVRSPQEHMGECKVLRERVGGHV
jgi:hypothetical protein